MITCAAVVSPWLSSLPPSAKTIVSLVAAIIGAMSLRGFLGNRFRRVACRSSAWVLVDGDKEHPALLTSHARLGDWLALEFKIDRGERVRFVLGPDNTDLDTRRRLTLLLSRGEIAHAA